MRRSPSEGKYPNGAWRPVSTREAPNANPFAAGNVEFLRQQRRIIPTGTRRRFSPDKTQTSAARKGSKVRQKEQAVLQALERLDNKDTVEQGIRQLKGTLSNLMVPADLVWFLRTVFDDRHPLALLKARREQIMLLPIVLHRCALVAAGSGHGDPNRSVSERAMQGVLGALRVRILPFLISALHDVGGPDIQEDVAAALQSILCYPLPQRLTENGLSAEDAFVQVCPVVIKALLDPLVLGTGWDVVVKRRCVQVLSRLAPTILEEGYGSARHVDLLSYFASQVMQCLAVNPGAQEGLLNCIMQISSEQGTCVMPHFRVITDMCTAHLLETPSVAPSYGQQAATGDRDTRAESPKRGILTRELALVCCRCLKFLALAAANEMPPNQLAALLPNLLPDVKSALARDNLNLQRLIRGSEALRTAIADALRAWIVLKGDGSDSEAIAWFDAARRERRATPSGPHVRKPLPPDQRGLELVADRQAVESPGALGRGRQAPCDEPWSRNSSLSPDQRAWRVGADGQAISSLNADGRGRHAIVVEPWVRNRSSSLDRHNEPRSSNAPSRGASDCFRTERRCSEPAECHVAEKDDFPTLGQWQSDTRDRMQERHGIPKSACAAGSGQAVAKQLRSSHEGCMKADGVQTPMWPRDVATWMDLDRATQTHAFPSKHDVATDVQFDAGTQTMGIAAVNNDALYQTDPFCGAGPIPPVTSISAALPTPVKGPAAIRVDEHICDQIPWSLPPDVIAPALSTVLRHVAAGHIDAAFQTLFRFGNEQTLRAILRQLAPTETWRQLPESEARYFTHLLAQLLSKDPLGKPAREACAWLDALLSVSGGAQLLAIEDLPHLRGALFSLSGNTGKLGQCAASVYYRLFHERLS